MKDYHNKTNKINKYIFFMKSIKYLMKKKEFNMMYTQNYYFIFKYKFFITQCIFICNYK